MVDVDLNSAKIAVPFEKLDVYDGLAINAERWAIDHDYHKRRQNLYFEALFEPGIVCGLGVNLIDQPSNTVTENKVFVCQIQIQPGIAMDHQGNVIVLPEEIKDNRRDFPIIIDPPEQDLVTAYIVVNFVEREDINESKKETIQESYRIDHKSEPPGPEEIEICRIELDYSCLISQDEEQGTNKKSKISLPKNSLSPKVGELNLCHRKFARLLPKKKVRVGVLVTQHQMDESDDLVLYQRLEALCSSLPSLYPEMQGSVELVSEDSLSGSTVQACDVLCLNGDYFLGAEDSNLLPVIKAEADSKVDFKLLRDYVNAGGRVLLDTPNYESSGAEEHNLISTIFHGLELMEWSKLWEKNHPILRKPFTFGASSLFANLDSGKEILRVSAGEQLICTGGSLSALWRGEGQVQRADIRTAQELGANLLHLVWRLRQLSNLCKDNRSR